MTAVSGSPAPALRQASTCASGDILVTEELARRPSRPADYQAESRALLALAKTLAASPASILQELVDSALALTGAESAGISIAEEDTGAGIFRWHAIAGELRRYLGGTMPRDFSPCGTVLDLKTALLMRDAVKFYPYISQLHVPCREILLIPFGADDNLLGTVWAVIHSDGKAFDAEDHRLLTSLSFFASAATKSLSVIDALTQKGGELAATQAKLSAALDAAQIGTWAWTPRNTLFADAFLRDMLGIKAADSDDLTFYEFMQAIHPDDRALMRQAIRSAFESDGPFQADFRVVGRDGQVRWVTSRGKATANALGELSDFSGVALDNTAKKLGELRDQEISRRQTEFLATLAHELRNPLAPIRNGVEILKSGRGDQAGVRDMMSRQLAHMVQLIDDLMDISRIASGKINLKRAPVRIFDIIESAIETTQQVLDAGHHQLLRQFQQDETLVFGDRLRLVQVFSNLLTNAYKYTPAGGRIAITVEQRAGSIAVGIADNGIGIDPLSLQSIFEMFGQLQRSVYRSQGGLGVGLSLARNLVEMHDGTISVTSAGSGQGSTFVVCLPVVAGAQPAVSEESEAVTATAREGVSLDILVVDDNIDSADSMKALLESCGHRVRAVYSGEDALAAVAERCPQLALLDIGLPGMSGHEVAARLRQRYAGQALTLVALTGWGAPADKQAAEQAGFNYHLTKPIEFAEIEAILEKLAG